MILTEIFAERFARTGSYEFPKDKYEYDSGVPYE